MNSTARSPSLWLATLAVAVPWLNPITWGPSPSIVQTLVTMVCTAVLLGLFALRKIDGRAFTVAVAQGWVLAAVVSSVIGLLQYFGASEALTPWVNITNPGQAFANLRQRNQFATLTNIGMAALLWWGARPLVTGDERGRSVARYVLFFFQAAVMALGNAVSSSRTGMMQLVLLWLCVALWSHFDKNDGCAGTRRTTGQLTLFALLVYGLALWVLPRLAGLNAAAHGALTRLVEGDRLCESRITLWSNVMQLIAQKPWFGWGWGELSYAHYVTTYSGPRFCAILDNAHNLPLQLAVELGVPAAVLLCSGAFVFALRARPWLERDPAKRVPWAVMAVILLHSMLEYPLWYGPFLMAAILCLVLLRQSRTATGLALPTNSRPLIESIAAACAAVTVLALAAYTAWDYHRISQIFLEPSERAPAYQDDTLSKLQDSRLFRNQVRYAELTTTAVTPRNADKMHELALDLLHFSPEPRVIKKLIESDRQLALDDEMLTHTQRLHATFAEEPFHR